MQKREVIAFGFFAFFLALLPSFSVEAACRAATATDVQCLRDRGITLSRPGMVCDADEVLLRQHCRTSAAGDIYAFLLSRLVEPHRTQRPYYVSDLDPAFAQCVATLIREADAAGVRVMIFSGARRAEDQARAVRQAAARGRPNYAAPVGRSPHQQGIAVDLTCNGGSNCAPLIGAIALRIGVDFPLMPGKPRGRNITEPWHLEPSEARCSTRGYTPPSAGRDPVPAAAAPSILSRLTETLGLSRALTQPQPPVAPAAALPVGSLLQGAFAPAAPASQPMAIPPPLEVASPAPMSPPAASSASIAAIAANPTVPTGPKTAAQRIPSGDERVAIYTPPKSIPAAPQRTEPTYAQKTNERGETFAEGSFSNKVSPALSPLRVLSAEARERYREAISRIRAALERLLEIVRGKRTNEPAPYRDVPEWDLPS